MVGLNLQIPEMLPGEIDGDLTEKQKRFILGLAREVGLSQLVEDQELVNSLSSSQASSVIDQLLSVKKMMTGDKQFDESNFSGFEDEGSKDSGGSDLLIGVAAVVAVVVVIVWMFA